MQVQVNSGDGIRMSDDLSRKIEAILENRLGRFDKRLTRVEVHLSDENAAKGGDTDKRCMIEARPNGHTPIAVTDQAGSVDVAVSGAAQRLERKLENLFGKLSDRAVG